MMPSSFLKGKNVLLTREESENKEFADWITKAGGKSITIPLIGFQSRQLDDVESKHLSSLSSYDWLVFTSKNGVEYFFQQVKELDLPSIAVIGTKTEAKLEQYGFVPQFVPSQFVAECFVAEFIPILKQNDRVLVLKGNLARSLIAERIRECGYICDEVILYENAMPLESEERLCQVMKREQLDVITFTSSSTVQHFMEIVDKYCLRSYLSQSVIACIGPIAQKTAEKYGLPVHICAQPYTIEGLFASLIAYEN